jgi:hypothetical protein
LNIGHRVVTKCNGAIVRSNHRQSLNVTRGHSYALSLHGSLGSSSPWASVGIA